jgi:serine/threonine-protein kinase RsbT
MSTVTDAINEELGPVTTTLVLSTLLNTLPVPGQTPTGMFDVATLQLLMVHIESALKLFSRDSHKNHLPALLALRRKLTGPRLPAATEAVVLVSSDEDVLAVQRRCQELTRHSFSPTDGVKLATAASELARNIYMYAKRGEIRLRLVEDYEGIRLELIATDQGPGIRDVNLVLSGQYTSKTGLGKGLRGTKSMLDTLEIQSSPTQGTTIHGSKRARR